MADNLADKLADLRAKGYTGEYPGDNWFTDINDGVDWTTKKISKVNGVVQSVPIKPVNLGVQYTEVEQVAWATIGGGQITVRDNTSLNLTGLNRDPLRALTEETKYNFDHSLKTPFGTLDQLTSYAKIVGQKSQDIEEYGFVTVVEERIEKGKSELQKGVNKLGDMFASFTEILRAKSK